ncbi:hypothetical protein XELAEV_18002239mg [Xenopus laevis]|nr:hypothetical protein XELAEV_18002239mg [Xenopus laevis]
MALEMLKIWWCFPVIFTMIGLCAPMQDPQMSPSQPAGPPIALYWAPALLLIVVLALALYFLLPSWHKPQLKEEEEAEHSGGTCIDALSCCGKGESTSWVTLLNHSAPHVSNPVTTMHFSVTVPSPYSVPLN